MDPHDGTDITRQVPATGSGGEILLGVQPVSINHEVPIGQVDFWSLGLVLAIEELRESPPFDGVNTVVVKPGSIARDDDVVGLLSHVVLMQVWVLGLLPLVARAALVLIL